MTKIKMLLHLIARLLRTTSKAIDHWPVVLLVLCIISPISPHVRIPYELSYSDCTYIGTRGVIEYDASSCSLITIIDTRPYREQS